MNAATYYRSSLSAESLKLKNTFSLWLAVLAPCALISMYVLAFWLKGDYLAPEGTNAWHRFAAENFGIYTLLLMPVFIALLTSQTNGIEHKSNGWKHLYSLPLPKSTIYVAKATTVVGLVLLSNVVFVLAYLAGGLLLTILRPGLGFESIAGLDLVLISSLKLFLASFVIVAMQFWLSMRWSSFVVSMGVGLVAVISVVVGMNWEYIHHYPFAYPFVAIRQFPNGADIPVLFTQEVWLSLSLGLVVFLLGYFDVSRKRIS